MVAYLDHADVCSAKSNQPQNIRLVLRSFRQLFSGMHVDDIGPAEWERIRQWFIDNGQTRSGINICMDRILAMFRWGAVKELRERDNSSGFEDRPDIEEGTSPQHTRS